MIWRPLKRYVRRGLHSILTLHGSPEAVAFGTAIGVFVAFTPTVGFQMLIGAFIATLVGANRPAAMIPAWITNPLTIPPIYALTYWVGSKVMFRNPDFWGVYHRLVDVVKAFGDFSIYTLHKPLLELLKTGLQMYVPMLVGGIIVGAICAGLTYPLMLRGVRSYRHGREILHERRLARRAARQERRRARGLDRDEHADGE